MRRLLSIVRFHYVYDCEGDCAMQGDDGHGCLATDNFYGLQNLLGSAPPQSVAIVRPGSPGIPGFLLILSPQL